MIIIIIKVVIKRKIMPVETVVTHTHTHNNPLHPIFMFGFAHGEKRIERKGPQLIEAYDARNIF